MIWGVIALGTMIRLVRYLLRYPLWVDECMLAEHFLDRGFLDFLSPLDHWQVAPVGFLWIELAIVRIFGFSEWSLRLFPLLCGIGSLFLFRHVASRLLSGIPLVLAVGCLAVAKVPVGLSAFVKPYSTDLLVALALLALAVEWLRSPQRTIWLWRLAAAAPLALILSFPAVFVGGAISLGLFWPLCRLRNRQAWSAFLAYNVLLSATFALTLVLNSGPNADAIRRFMLEWWTNERGFPPLNLAQLAKWLVDVHLGDNFAVPCGADNGGGTVTFICCAAASAVMYRRGQGPVLTIFLTTFGLSFLAAVFRRYPYGGHARVLQFLVPAVALMSGLGAATLLSRVSDLGHRRRLAQGLVAALALFGGVMCCRNILHPYKDIYDEIHREFARRFWRDEPDTTTLCGFTHLGRDFTAGAQENSYYRCNQRLFSPPGHDWRRLSVDEIQRLQQPVRLVVFHTRNRAVNQPINPLEFADCLKEFEPALVLSGHETYAPPTADDPDGAHGIYEIYHFLPRSRLAREAQAERLQGRQ